MFSRASKPSRPHHNKSPHHTPIRSIRHRTTPNTKSPRHGLNKKKSTWHHHKQHFSTTEINTIPDQIQPPRRRVHVYKCLDPTVPYALGFKWMQELLDRKTNKENPELRDVLFIVQHQPVYTLGKRASIENFRFDHNKLIESRNEDDNGDENDEFAFDLQRIGRGGEVTYHGPGQLTVYPVLNLNNFKKDLHWYVEQLESTVLHTLAKYGIDDAGIDPDNPGVWIGSSKVSAIGAQFKRWNTMHGFSINVNPIVHDGFNRIVPCGINGREVTSLEELIKMKKNNNINISPITHDNDLGGLDPTQLGQLFTPPVLKLPKRYQELPKPDQIFDLKMSTPSQHQEELSIDFVADQIADSFAHVFDVDLITKDYSIIDFYDMSLENELIKPRVWLREIDQAMD